MLILARRSRRISGKIRPSPNPLLDFSESPIPSSATLINKFVSRTPQEMRTCLPPECLTALRMSSATASRTSLATVCESRTSAPSVISILGSLAAVGGRTEYTIADIEVGVAKPWYTRASAISLCSRVSRGTVEPVSLRTREARVLSTVSWSRRCWELCSSERARVMASRALSASIDSVIRSSWENVAWRRRKANAMKAPNSKSQSGAIQSLST